MEQIATTHQATSAEQRTTLPYPPSWVDRFTDWVERLPGPAWLFYLAVALALVLIRTIIGWSDGSYPVGDFFPIHILDGLNPVSILFVLHYLDDMAQRALADFRPVLNVGPEDTRDAGYEKLRYQITTMPSRPVFVLSLIGVVLGLAYTPILLTEAELQMSKYFTSPAATALDSITSVLFATMLIIFAYHTFHQLRLVSRIYTRHTNVSIFDIGPLYALSRVTAITTIAWLFFVSISVAFYSDLQMSSPIIGVLTVAFVLIALGTFVWPLWGAHRLLQEAKTRRKSEVARRMEAITDEVHHRVDTHDLQGADALKDTLDGLIAERGVLDKVSTWPWEPEAARVVVTALLLPVVIWIITRVLERLGF